MKNKPKLDFRMTIGRVECPHCRIGIEYRRHEVRTDTDGNFILCCCCQGEIAIFEEGDGSKNEKSS